MLIVFQKYVLLKKNKLSNMKTFLLTLLFCFSIQLFYSQNHKYHLMVGTFTNTGISQGIYTYDINMMQAVFIPKSVTSDIINPNYLTITPDKKFVYSVVGDGVGRLSAFSFNSSTAKLSFLNKVLTEGADPCHVLATDKHVITGNYSGGSVSVFGRNADGSLTNLVQRIQHVRQSQRLGQQIKPHVHQVLLSPDRKFVLANDLGEDNVIVYKYNSDSSTEILSAYDTLAVKAGSGPRHATFSKNGKMFYLLQEIDGTVSVCSFNAGKLKLLQETSVVTNKSETIGAADIHLSADGRFLYASNRGTSNTITCFAVGTDGKLTFKQQISAAGKGPRGFAISPDGRYLFVGNQYTNEIVIFRLNKKTGVLWDSGKRIDVGAPVCLKFY